MDVAKLNNSDDEKKEDEVVQLPGFRFHPTDEELVGFYLRRKVEKKTLRIELIKQIDIYKYDPWDLPKVNSVVEKEWYFFCMRGRKYRNSVRPNRVTRSGFWKATGIDKPIYCVEESHKCIGLKKSLVFYRGSAGKGTKTDWMMHEFRLPPNGKTSKNPSHNTTIDVQEAEVWTLCRIFKRIPTYKKYTPITKPNPNNSPTSNKPYITFTDSTILQQNERKPFIEYETNHLLLSHQLANNNNVVLAQSPTTLSHHSPTFWNQNVDHDHDHDHDDDHDDAFGNYQNWDDLRSVVQFAFDPSN